MVWEFGVCVVLSLCVCVCVFLISCSAAHKTKVLGPPSTPTLIPKLFRQFGARAFNLDSNSGCESELVLSVRWQRATVKIMALGPAKQGGMNMIGRQRSVAR